MTTHALAYARAAFDAVRQRDVWEGHRFAARVWQPAAGADADAALAAALAERVRRLDGTLLNEQLPDVADAGLAGWLARVFCAYADVASHPRTGVRSAAGGLSVWRRLRFEAAHRLPRLPATHKCARLHGHGFEVVLRAHATPATVDEVRASLAGAWQSLAPRLHGACLNDIAGLDNPTSERLAAWLWQALEPQLDLAAISVFETCTSACRFDGERMRIAKSSRFEAALDGPGGVFGHSYLVRLHAAGALDEELGWVLDFGDMKRLFAPLYRQLDHHHLDAALGQAATPYAIAAWISERLRPQMPALAGVDVLPTPDRGILLRSEGHTDPD